MRVSSYMSTPEDGLLSCQVKLPLSETCCYRYYCERVKERKRESQKNRENSNDSIITLKRRSAH